MVAQRDDWLSIEDFLALDRESLDQKYEYMDGHMYALEASLTKHAIILSNTLGIIGNHLEDSSYVALAAMTLRTDDACFLPDVMVTGNEKDLGENKTYIEFPRLVIEVVSPDTENKDRGAKFLRYLDCPSVQEYALMSQDVMIVEVYTRKDSEWGYRRYEYGKNVEFKSIGLIFPIEEIYERVIL